MFGWYDEDDHQWQAWVGVAVAVTGGLILRQKRRPSRTRELSIQHFCVTGSSCGIGEAVVKELVQRGAGSVVLAVRNEHRGAQIVKELREGAGKEALAAECGGADICKALALLLPKMQKEMKCELICDASFVGGSSGLRLTVTMKGWLRVEPVPKTEGKVH